MKMVIIEPLGVDEDKLLSMAKEALGDRVEIVYHDTKVTGTQELIERGKDAEIIVAFGWHGLPRPLDARYWHTAGLSRMWRESVL